MRRFVLAWVPVAIMCIAIFLFSQDANSGRHSEEVLRWLLELAGVYSGHLLAVLNGPFRKLAHVIVYFLLGGMSYRGFAYGKIGFARGAAIRSLLFSFVYACTDEYHQSWIPGRGPSPRDVMLDTAAALVAIVLMWLFTRTRKSPPLVAAVAQSAK